jgi:hypothetical protein
MRATPCIVTILLLACGRRAAQGTASDSLPVAAAPAIHRVTLERTPCFGSCPDYVVVLGADGAATYHGGRFAPRHGDFRSSVPAADFARLASRLGELGFFAMDSAYTQNVTDLPTFTLTVATSAGGHAVMCYGFGCPPAFHQLTALVDSVADGLSWDSLPATP